MISEKWHGKPYYSLDAWCKNELHKKCYKVALNAHMTCPNRDGKCGTRGCIFCSEGGSGDFSVDFENAEDIESQLAEGISLISRKLPADALESACFIAYFQAYTNTYAPVDYLRKCFTRALSSPLVCGISIATRPDCLGEEVLDLLSELKAAFPDKFIWLELGLQTIHESTAAFIRRGYNLDCFKKTAAELQARHLPYIVHIILGLPGETKEDMYETVSYLNRLQPFGIKFQLLHYLKNTDLGLMYEAGECSALTKDSYLEILIRCLELLSPEIVVHRVTGDGPKKLLLAPLWSGNKRDVLNSLHAQMRALASYQGKLFIEHKEQ